LCLSQLIFANAKTIATVGLDTLKFNSLIDQARELNRDSRNKEKCEQILAEALQIAIQDSNYKALARVYNSYGVLYRNTAEYTAALEYHSKAVQFAQKANNLTLLASSYNSIGVVYRRLDDHPRATQFHLLGLKAAEQVNDKSNKAVSLNSLGNIYSLNGQYSIALSYFQQALKLAKNMNNVLGQAINYNNIGEVFEFSEQMDSALFYYSKSLEANNTINSLKGIGISYNAIGKIYLYKGKTSEALDLFQKALEIDLNLGDKKFIADSYINLGRAYINLKKYASAEHNSIKGLEIAQEIGSITHSQWAYENLSIIHANQNQFARALQYNKLATKFKDSLINEKNTRAIAMMEVIFSTEKKEQEIQILKQTQEINKKELARQKARRNIYLIGFIFTLFLFVAVLFALSVKRKANILLEHQKQEIEKSHQTLILQKNEIVQQNLEIEKQRSSIELKNNKLIDAYRVIESYVGKITDSIRYAQRIQKAILPPLAQTSPFFSDHFAFYKPKDFVSGDFYWLTIKNNTLFLAVADCTGHGVPGALMSIIGMDLLNQAVNQQMITEPSEILNYLNVELRNKFRKEEEEELVLKDSMDISIIRIEKKSKQLCYSGALMPLTILRRSNIIEYKPHFMSIGTSPKLIKSSFKQQNIELEPGDWLYLYSDGFMDQFGGGENRRFMRSNFFALMQKANSMSGENQKVEFAKVFEEWKGNNDQIDDVVVLGFKV
jgi:serine phosphatase RsbU (regulator of sigma subunit)